MNPTPATQRRVGASISYGEQNPSCFPTIVGVVAGGGGGGSYIVFASDCALSMVMVVFILFNWAALSLFPPEPMGRAVT